MTSKTKSLRWHTSPVNASHARQPVLQYLKSIAPTVGLSLAATAAWALPEYGDVWRPPSGCTKYYSTGNGHHFCVIHDMEGYYYTAVSYLNRCDISASIHYAVNGLTDSSDNGAPPGQITQCVLEANYAWHAGCWNKWMFGTEHEGFASNPAWFTEAMYQASAGLHRHLCDTYSIPKDRNHIIAHGQKLVAGWCTWLAANYPSITCTCNSHTDPGPYWDWNHFMALIIGQVNNASIVSSSVPSSVVAGQAFTATITLNNNGSKPWATGGSTPHSLGSQTPQDNTTWGFGRVALPSSPINVGQNATFTLHPTAPTTPGTYAFAWRMVQEGVEWFGATFSANISVVSAGPTVTTQPVSQSVNPGTTVHFTVAATGTGTLTYRWRNNGVNLSNGGKISGATSTALTITNVQQADVGNYSVAVTDSRGTITSASAALTVNSVVAFYEDFEHGLGNWGTFVSPGTALTISTAQHLSGTQSAHVAGSWDRMYRNLGISVDGHLRITAWVYDSTQTRSFVDVRGYSGGSYNNGGLVQLFCAGKYNTVTMTGETWDNTKYQGRVVAGANAGWFNLNASGAPSRSTGWHKFVIERRADGTTIDFYVDNILSRTITGAAAGSLDSAAIGSVGSGTSNVAGEAWIDDVQVDYFDLPVITTQPVGQTVVAGGTANFSVVAANTIGGYQWRKNGTNITSATTSALTLNNVQGSDAANYDVVVSNGAGPVDSAAVPLRVAPAITSQPANTTNLPLTTATFTVVAAGQTPFSYQWRRNGTNLVDGGNLFGTVSATLTVNSVTPDDAGSYSVVVTNIAGTATSANALLVPVLLPTITTSPTGQAVAAGTNVTFTTSATGTPPLFYQWNLNGTDISGATGTSYTRLNVQSGDAGTYSVIASNAAGAVASDGALLTVNTTPALSPIADQTITAGETLSFTAQASDIDTNQALTFSLDPGAPLAAAIVSTNGAFSWPTTAADAGTTNHITVRVTDSGSPSLSDSKTFAAIVLLPPITVSLGVSNQDLTIGWNSISGQTYRVEYKDDWSATTWSNLAPDVPATGPSASITDTITFSQRFYRVRLLN
jgi:N-acetylmuramoyl-L-alanine amidase/Immunoglobulin I-set domain/Ig-like domain from next to BRCA1 gene/Immunoglobulin domain